MASASSIKAAVNAPLSDTAAMRVAAYYTRYGGFMDAVQPDLSVKKDVNDGDRTGARVMFRFEPDKKLTITPRILYQEVKMNGWNRIDAFNILANPYTTTRPKVNLGSRELFTQIKEPFTDKFLLGDVNVGYDLGGGRNLTSITSYSDRNVDVVRDATALTASITGGSIGLPANIYTLNAPLDDATKAKSYTQELRLSGSMPKLQWVIGGFYGHTDRKYGQSLLVSGFEALSKIPTAGTFGAAKDVLFFSKLKYNFKQAALFGEGTYSVSDKLDLTGGLRLYNFNESRTQTFDGIFAAPGTTAGSSKANGFAPRVIAAYKLNDTTKLNAQISKGFRLGGINDPLNVPLCTPQDLLTFGGRGNWKDETLWNYEVGSKSKVAGGRGSVNVAAFYADIKDLQADRDRGFVLLARHLQCPKGSKRRCRNGVRAGADRRFRLCLLGDSHRLQTAVDTDIDRLQGQYSIVSGIQSGNRLPTVPQNQAAAAATYHWHANQNWAGYATGAYQYIGSRFTQIGDQAAGFGTVNLNSFAPNNIGGPFTQSTFTFNPRIAGVLARQPASRRPEEQMGRGSLRQQRVRRESAPGAGPGAGNSCTRWIPD